MNSLRNFVVSHIYIFEPLDPWVTTIPINRDMIRLVGNALHRDMCGADVPCIGFCSWEYVKGIFITNANVTYHSLYNLTRYSSDRLQRKERRTTTKERSTTTKSKRLEAINSVIII